MQRLKSILNSIDGRGYKEYKQLRGSYEFDDFTLFVDHVQGDPFASPSKLRIRVPQEAANFDRSLFSNHSRRIAFQDYIIRQFDRGIGRFSKGVRGTGKSGLVFIDSGRQEIMERSASLVTDDFVEVRFYIGLPARGRTVTGRQCLEVFADELPKIASLSLFSKNLDTGELKEFIDTSEDQDILRKHLKNKGLVSFIANGSILPRRSGISDRPLAKSESVIFKSPEELEVSLVAPHRGKITGMGIPEGITLIIGGGFHGKSTLLSAIEKGIYNHIPGDGREYAVTVDTAVKIRAEEGRNIQKVNISSFISNLPFGKDTVEFTTADASGSTSQAANIIEALECKAGLLLLDEDTSATNFLIRDEIMQKMVPKEKEPITPFIDQVDNIFKGFGTSSVLVMGGSGDYFEVADTVIMMDSYLPYLVTSSAKNIISKRKESRTVESLDKFDPITRRVPVPSSIDPYKGKKVKVRSRGLNNILFGTGSIDLSAVEQIVDSSQVNAISDMILYGLKMKYIDGNNSLEKILDLILADIKRNGLDVLSGYQGEHPGSYALPRKFEAAAALNRLRSLEVRQI